MQIVLQAVLVTPSKYSGVMDIAIFLSSALRTSSFVVEHNIAVRMTDCICNWVMGLGVGGRALRPGQEGLMVKILMDNIVVHKSVYTLAHRLVADCNN